MPYDKTHYDTLFEVLNKSIKECDSESIKRFLHNPDAQGLCTKAWPNDSSTPEVQSHFYNHLGTFMDNLGIYLSQKPLEKEKAGFESLNNAFIVVTMRCKNPELARIQAVSKSIEANNFVPKVPPRKPKPK